MKKSIFIIALLLLTGGNIARAAEDIAHTREEADGPLFFFLQLGGGAAFGAEDGSEYRGQGGNVSIGLRTASVKTDLMFIFNETENNAAGAIIARKDFAFLFNFYATLPLAQFPAFEPYVGFGIGGRFGEVSVRNRSRLTRNIRDINSPTSIALALSPSVGVNFFLFKNFGIGFGWRAFFDADPKGFFTHQVTFDTTIRF